MGKIYHERRLDSVPYSENGTKTLELPRNNIYRALKLRLTGTLTTTATAPVTKKSFTPFKLIKRIEIIANGKDTIKSIPFFMLRALNLLDFCVEPEMTDVGVAVSTGYPFVASAILPFAFTQARTPIDGALDARRLETLSLQITWGSPADLYATPNAAAITVCQLAVETEEYIDSSPDFKAYLNKHTQIQKEVISTTSELQERLPVGQVYRRLMLVTMVDDVLNGSVLNKVALKSGTFVFKDATGVMIRQQMKLENSITTLDTGVYLLNLLSDGMLTECINTKGMSSFELVLDVTKQTGTNMIHIFPEVVEG